MGAHFTIGAVKLYFIAKRLDMAVIEDFLGHRVEIPEGDLDRTYQTLSSPKEYLEKIRHSEGFKNPKGIKGGVSGICKAVYNGIGGAEDLMRLSIRVMEINMSKAA